MKRTIIYWLTLLFAGVLNGQTLDCKQCHYCDKPTMENPCLKRCPRHDKPVTHPKANGTEPDVLILKEIESLYVPVVFSHKLHSDMSQYSGGCAICHHHNPPGPILKCSACHEKSAIRGDLRKPGLKGAYHRQCLGCHREWSHSTACGICHAPKSRAGASETVKTAGDIVGAGHPAIPEPERIIFHTGYEEGDVVTFYHDEHIKLFGLNCVDCHRSENCSTCHDTSKPVVAEAHLTEPHEPCYQCHEQNECSVCHSNEIRGRFDHLRRTGWALNNYHRSQQCSACHKERLVFESRDTNCLGCHKSWLNGSFDHSVTGLKLDEIHLESACEDCHIDNRFDRKPQCDNCHDGFSYPKQKPGV
jgi:hypothetical protein